MSMNYNRRMNRTTSMNRTVPMSSSSSHAELSSSAIFLIISLSFLIICIVAILKILFPCPVRPIEPQMATPIIIEIPIAVSISTQSVENDYIGTVI